MIDICGRKVKVRTGAKTQTVNICSSANVHGLYDYIVRLRPPFISQETLLRQNFSSIQDVVRYLECHHGGEIERAPAIRSSSATEIRSNIAPPAPDGPPTVASAKFSARREAWDELETQPRVSDVLEGGGGSKAVNWIEALPIKGRRGSLLRCLFLTKGSREDVAQRLTTLVGRNDVSVSPGDFWMPKGLPVKGADGRWDLSPAKEAKLGEAPELLPLAERAILTNWWLAVSKGANTPNWDLASSCTVRGEPGLLLVEAKAHHMELWKGAAGKPAPDASANSQANHERIGEAIQSAQVGLREATGVPWGISRDTHYQMSNRFAWAWKLTELKYPVVLVYLGFLNATEMKDQGNPFDSHEEWVELVRLHSSPICRGDTWDQLIRVNGLVLLPLIRSVEQPIETSSVETTNMPQRHQ
jgi:hypothetical protein